MNNTRYDFGHHQTIVTIKLDEHVHATDNPHKVTKGQVGLGNVDNVSFDEIKNYTNTYAGSYLTVESDEEGKYSISLYNKNNQKLGESIEIDTDNEFTIESASLDLENKKLIFERKNADDLECDITSLIDYVDNELDKKVDKEATSISIKGIEKVDITSMGNITLDASAGDVIIKSDTASDTSKVAIDGTVIPKNKTLFTTDGGTIKGNVTIEPGTEHESAAQLNICTHSSSEGKLSLGAGSLAVSGKNGGGEIASALDLKLTARMGNVIISSQTEDESPASSGVTIDGTAIPRNKTLETVDNKVTSWSTITTDTHYPSEKLVKAECDNIRAVAEGKCNTWILSYNAKIPTTDGDLDISSPWSYYTESGERLTNISDYKNYVKQITEAPSYDEAQCLNPKLNSQAEVVGGNAFEYALLPYSGVGPDFKTQHVLQVSKIPGVWRVEEEHMGDIILVAETNVPDRWLGKMGVLYKLETSKVDLGWSQIGTTADPKPTTLAGYGITDALPISGGTLTGDLTILNLNTGKINLGSDTGEIDVGNGSLKITADTGNGVIQAASIISIKSNNWGSIISVIDRGIIFDSVDSMTYETTKKGYYKLPVGDSSTSNNRHTLATQEWTGGNFVNRAGDTMTGTLSLSNIANPNGSIKINSEGILELVSNDSNITLNADDNVIITSGTGDKTTIDGTDIPKSATLLTSTSSLAASKITGSISDSKIASAATWNTAAQTAAKVETGTSLEEFIYEL